MKKKIRKPLFLLILAAIFSLTACGASGSSKEETIKLGCSLPQTGAVAHYGKTSQYAMEMAVEEINQSGGILGKKVEWFCYDDQGDATQAVAAYNKLLEDGIVCNLGPFTSRPAIAVAETAVNDGLPMISPGGTHPKITEGKENVFRLGFTDAYQGRLLAQFAKDKLGAKSYAILLNNSADCANGIAEGFRQEAEKLGLERAAEEGYQTSDTDFSAQLTKIKAAHPDLLLIPDYYEQDALIIPQARRAGLTCPFLGGDGWDGLLDAMNKEDYPDLDGCYFTNHFSLDSRDERVQTFIQNYRKRVGEDPTAFSGLGYDAVYLAKQAIEEAGSAEPEAIVQALRKIQFSGVTGTFSYDENNNPRKTANVIGIKEGKLYFDSNLSLRGE